ncbi:outer membrane protein [Helicobacter cetorum]|uniref:Outer membrane protein HopP n=1 Tax=Helicobacter cetorum (strain ATCC BAA-540 / CCUG 52418 / MIT 99-5656) TaxID=1163745 RepID=I0ERZ0_HELCM|nr:outer membrane protein [Helicobacter cetorum]AFI05709.1 outer membrane protein HopP [Helicobacter cetorum MIT 99-5656]
MKKHYFSLALTLLLGLHLNAEENGWYSSLGYQIGESNQQMSVNQKVLESQQQLKKVLTQAQNLANEMSAPSPTTPIVSQEQIKLQGNISTEDANRNIWGNNPTQVAASSVLQAANNIATTFKQDSQGTNPWTKPSNTHNTLCDVGQSSCNVLDDLQGIINGASAERILPLKTDLPKDKSSPHWNNSGSSPSSVYIDYSITNIVNAAQSSIQAITLTRENESLADKLPTDITNSNVSSVYDTLNTLISNNSKIHNANMNVGNELNYIAQNVDYFGLGGFTTQEIQSGGSDARLASLWYLLNGKQPDYKQGVANYTPYAQGGFIKEQNALASAYQNINKSSLALYNATKSAETTTNSGVLNGVGFSIGYKHFFGKKKAWGLRVLGFVDYNHTYIKADNDYFSTTASLLTYGGGIDILYNFINDKELKNKNKLSVGTMLGVAFGHSTWLSTLHDKLSSYGSINATNYQLLWNFGMRINLAHYKNHQYRNANGFELGIKIPSFSTNYYNNNGTKLSYGRIFSFYFNYVHAF